MALFVGQHLNKIDKKGRVSVPKRFRDPILRDGFSGIYVYPSFKYAALELCDEAYMERIADSVGDLDMFSDEQDDLASVILANAHPLDFDPEGRVVLPAELREHAGIGDQVLFVGSGQRAQVWNPDDFKDQAKSSLDRARASKATLKLAKKREARDD